jgi:NCAIR mutase (PurE)-related protein
MYRDQLKTLLADVKGGSLTIDGALKKLENLPYEDLGFANIDHHRALRQGFPEVIFCENKTPGQVAAIFERLSESGTVLATRASQEIFDAIRASFPDAEYHELARAIVYRRDANPPRTEKSILICSAGTSDIPVADEAFVTANVMGNPVEKLYDVGVAGIHRLLNNKDKLTEANVLIVVAGMDGALPAVVGGIVERPVIAVPTSVGYGASFQGIGPLLTMLNACSPGVVVVNIDNGFGAGYFASLINKVAE